MRKLTGIIVCVILLFSCNKNKKDTGNDSVNGSANDQDIYENVELQIPPSHNDLAGLWKIPVPASVETIGFLELYLGEDGTAEIAAGDDIRIKGFWSLDGARFKMRPAEGVEQLDYFGFPWFDGVENLRVTVFEYKGKLYKACNIFGQSSWDCYQANNMPPLEYFGYY
jgi:hypothetical protein